MLSLKQILSSRLWILTAIIIFGILGRIHNQSVWYAQENLALPKDCAYQYMKVTAYYTPLSGQGVYFNGDYETEKKINWGNRYGASGKYVFNGMLAWPKWYPYGTTIKLPGYGIGWVYDRWWAIVSTSWYDVIDIRAWSWLDGMIKALYRWSKMMTWIVCASGFLQWPLGFDRSLLPWVQDGLTRLLWTLSMQEGNNSVLVSYLQSFLVQLWYLPSTHTTTTLFWPLTTKALCLFQQKTMDISSDDEYCGYYGPKTRKKMSDLVRQWVLIIPTIDSWMSLIGLSVDQKKQKKKRILHLKK